MRANKQAGSGPATAGGGRQWWTCRVSVSQWRRRRQKSRTAAAAAPRTGRRGGRMLYNSRRLTPPTSRRAEGNTTANGRTDALGSGRASERSASRVPTDRDRAAVPSLLSSLSHHHRPALATLILRSGLVSASLPSFLYPLLPSSLLKTQCLSFFRGLANLRIAIEGCELRLES